MEPYSTEMDAPEATSDPFDAEEDFRLPKAGEIDRNLLPLYVGRWVAWDPDGKGIVAHAEDTTALTKLVTEAGMSPSRCIFERIEEDSLL